MSDYQSIQCQCYSILGPGQKQRQLVLEFGPGHPHLESTSYEVEDVWMKGTFYPMQAVTAEVICLLFVH